MAPPPIQHEDDDPAIAAADMPTENDQRPPLDIEPEIGARAEDARDEDGPVHRPLIRASLPRPEGQAPPARQIPDFTIRQPGGGRPNRFRARHSRPGGGGQTFHGHRSNGSMPGGPARGGMPRHGGGRPPMAKRHGGGRKRSK
jgi:hypothetical protein